MRDARLPDPEWFTRARGALLGLAVGYRLGLRTVHLHTREAIRVAFPDGVRYLATPESPALPADDDAAAMALLLGDSLAASVGFDVADVARRWVGWMKMERGAVGPVTARALQLIESGTEPFEAGRLAQASAPGSADGAGSVLRAVPLALRFHGHVDRLIRVSAQQAAITHADERCGWGAAAVSVAVRELLLGNVYFVDEVLHHLRDLAPASLRAAIHRAPREEQADLRFTVAGRPGDVERTVETAFWFATHGQALEDALVFLAGAGGDSDVNAGLAGALLGARDGESGIPSRWLDQLPDVSRLRELADQLISMGG